MANSRSVQIRDIARFLCGFKSLLAFYSIEGDSSTFTSALGCAKSKDVMKITGGIHKGRVIRTVEGPGYRPAQAKVREALFSMLASRGMQWQGAHVLDLFAGSGSLGLEALSRGAEAAAFVDTSRKAAAALKQTLSELGIVGGQYRVTTADVFAYLGKRPDRAFDLIFIDPPYRMDFFEKALRKCVKGGFLAEGGMLVAEVEAAVSPNEELLQDMESRGLTLDVDRLYGQTRILLWIQDAPPQPSTQAPSTP
jgi:16S rRNA (guanine966-N2)-methyltransferase